MEARLSQDLCVLNCIACYAVEMMPVTLSLCSWVTADSVERTTDIVVLLT
jgi:hypothetical protein